MKKLVIFVTAILLLLAYATPALAQPFDAAGFTVSARIPENQKDSSSGYFNLLMEPGAQQVLRVDITNTKERPLTVDIALRNASTNRNGVIEYLVDVMPDSTLKYPFETIATAPSELTIPAGETKRLDVTLRMPRHGHEGVILGGIVVTGRQDEAEITGMSINNVFSYVIGVKLTGSYSAVPADFELISVEPTLINYRSAVVANIRNGAPAIVRDAHVTATIYRDGDTEPVLEMENTNVSMAPNSIFPMSTQWVEQTIAPGDYRMEMTLLNSGQSFAWTESFTISGNQAQELNNRNLELAVAVSQTTNLLWWWIPLLLLMPILLIFAFFIGKRNRERPQENK